MRELFLLSKRQMARISPFFPLPHGVPRVDDRRVMSGIVYVIRNGLQWKDAPADYGPHKTLYNRFVCWSLMGVFDRIFAGLAGEGPEPERMMIDATHLKAHRTAASLLKRGCSPPYRAHQGRAELQAHTVCDGDGRPIILLLSEGQMNGHKGARLVLDALPTASHLVADRGYDSAWFRAELQARSIEPCIPSSRSRKIPFDYNKTLYCQRHKVENLFAKLKDWRRIATRYDHRCATPSSLPSASPQQSYSGYDQ